MLTKTRIVIAAVLVIASASASLAATVHRNAYRNPAVSSQGYGGGLVPGSAAEARWFEHASSHTGL